MNRRSPPTPQVPVIRLCKIGIRVTAQELERIRIAAAKDGLRAGSWAAKVVVDAALKAA